MRRHAGGLKPPTPFFASPGTWARAPGGPLAPGRGCPLALPRSAGPKEKEGRREGKREGEGRGEKERGGRRKPVRAVPTAPGEPAQIARGAPRGAERRVLEEGPGGGAAQAPIWKCQLLSAARPQPRRKRKSLPFPHSPAHRPEQPRSGNPQCLQAKASKSQGTRRSPSVSRPSRLAEPLKVFGPPPPPRGQPPAQ